MIDYTEIKKRLTDYVLGRTTLDQFESWFVSASWNMQQDSDQSACALAGGIELILAEYTSGHHSEEFMRGMLFQLSRILSRPQLEYWYGSDTVTISAEAWH